MAKWLNESKWDTEIASAAGTFGVPAALVKAIIGAESGFVPSVKRPEVRINDASAGLMQILHGTARGQGYSGDLGDPSRLTGLFDPATNIRFGTSFLASMYRRTGGNVASTISAYNGGYRPDLGFGAPATKAVRLCLARDTKTGDCISWRDVKPGEYGNKPYVDKVLGYYSYFANQTPSPVTPTVTYPTGSPSRPLDDAHREPVKSESENGGHGCRSDNRTHFIVAWEALKRWFDVLRNK